MDDILKLTRCIRIWCVDSECVQHGTSIPPVSLTLVPCQIMAREMSESLGGLFLAYLPKNTSFIGQGI